MLVHCLKVSRQGRLHETMRTRYPSVLAERRVQCMLSFAVRVYDPTNYLAKVLSTLTHFACALG